MKFAVFTVSTPEYDPRQTVRRLREIGYDGVEWRIAAAPPAEKPADYTYERRYWCYNQSTLDLETLPERAAEVRAFTSEAGLEICSLTTYLQPDQLAAVERVLQAARQMDCPNIRVNAPNFKEGDHYPALFERTVGQLRQLEPLAARYGVRINLEIHMGNIIPSASAAYRLVSGFDPRHIGIIFDPGNMVYEGFENYRLGVELLGPYLAHVHVKNAIWQQTETTPDGVQVWQPTWAPVKSGFADLRRLARVLKEAGYQGYLSLEDFSNEEDTESKLRNNLAFMKEITA
jgi:sugar phosphate isomerase/epimerase